MDRPFNLAIETSGRNGAVALGRGDGLLATRSLASQRRHDIGLMPAVDALCREHGVGPRDLGQVYVSLGPGSFTGLRVGVSVAKMLTLATDVKLVGVPTIQVLAENAPGDEPVAVWLNFKRDAAYCGVYRGGETLAPPALRTLDELLALAPRPLHVIAEQFPEVALPEGVTLLPAETAVARPEATWRLGRAMAVAGRFTPPAELSPLYVREPEAVTLWNERHGG